MNTQKVIEVDGERWINLAGFEKYLHLIETGFKKDEVYSGVAVLNFLEKSRNLTISYIATMKLKRKFIN